MTAMQLALWISIPFSVQAAESHTGMGGQTRQLFQGYTRTLRGGTIEYSSCQPDANSALIVRSLDANDRAEWETEPVPDDFKGDFATFVWIFGINANLEKRSFDLLLNDEKWFTFSRPDKGGAQEWSFAGKNGARLEFRATFVDKYDDLFGYALLKVPAASLSKGKPLKMSVHGETAGSRAWYMTFQHTLSDTVMITPYQALLKEGGKGLQPVAVDIVYFGEHGHLQLSTGRTPALESNLEFGFNRFLLKLPEAKSEENVNLEVVIDNEKRSTYPFLLKPIRKWTIYLVQHAHTDIGYTRPQTDILPEHLRFIDYALDYCDQTDHYPDDAKFRWTCEASWPVREYLRNRPLSQIERLKKRVREGRIEVTGMMFNMAEIADENSYAAFLQPIKEFKQRGIPVVSAMQDDVNGAAWCLVDYFSDIGVKYLTMGQNASRALKPFDIPTSFWWESPSAKRLLVFRADHYMTGNFLTIEQGKIQKFEPELFAYLRNLETKHYPFDRIAVQYSGYYTDNSAPSTAAGDVIKEWNERYAWPRLRNATVHEFPEYVEREHGTSLQTFRAAWPDWWTDGVGSAARETAAARKTQAEMTATSGLFSMARMLGSAIPDEVFTKTEAVQDALLFYDEHTFGAAESITDPRVENSMVQWAEKSAYAWDAVKNARLLRETAMGLLQGHLLKADVPTVTVFNTLNWSRSGLHTVYIDNQILPPDRKFRIVDPSGKSVPAQLESRRADGSYWGMWLNDVPAMGFKTYRIETSKEYAATPVHEGVPPTALENEFYRIIVDSTKGALSSIYDKQLRQELVDGACGWQAGQFIYETLTNREQLEQLRLQGYSRTTLKNVSVKGWTDGEIWTSILVTGQTEACAGTEGVTLEIRLFKREKRIELRYAARKLPVTTPEGIYVAFPFSLPRATILYEAQGGMVIPGVNQIPGSSSDWHTVQSFAATRSPQGQIVLESDEIPLVQFGGINTGRFQPIAHVEHPYMFSWVLNNYWGTNFVASQEGELKWSYSLTSTKDTSTSFATRFGWGGRVPFVSRVLPAGSGYGRLPSESFLKIDAPNLVLVSATPCHDGSGIIACIRETEGKPAQLTVSQVLTSSQFSLATHVNVLGEKLRDDEGTIPFRSHEVKFVKFHGK